LGCKLAQEVYGGAFDPGTPRSIVLKPSRAEKSLESVTPTRVVVRNETAQPIHVRWIDYQGKRSESGTSAAPHAELAVFTWRTHAFAVTNDAGDTLATFVAPDEDALFVVGQRSSK
jgi:hypothetical protein